MEERKEGREEAECSERRRPRREVTVSFGAEEAAEVGREGIIDQGARGEGTAVVAATKGEKGQQSDTKVARGSIELTDCVPRLSVSVQCV